MDDVSATAGEARNRDSPADPPASGDERHFVTSAMIVGALTFLSRLGGLARDAVCARVFGAGMEMNAFGLAFLLPNLFRKLFGEGALSAAFIPEYTRLRKENPAQARHFAAHVLRISAMLLCLVTLLMELILFVLLVTVGQAPGADARELMFRLSLIMVPYMPMVCLVALVGGALQVHGRFAVTAAAPIILNLGMIAGVGAYVWIARGSGAPLSTGALWLSWSVTATGVAQLALSCWSFRLAMAHMPAAASSSEADLETARRVREMLAMLGPMVVGLGVVQANAFLDGVIAGYPTYVGPTILGFDYPLDEASFSIVAVYTSRLYQFPLGVFGVAIATAIFPALARGADDRDALTHTLRQGVRFAIFMTLPAAVGLMIVGIPLAAVVYEGGEFSTSDTLRVADVLIGYAPSVIGFSLIGILGRAFYSLGDARTPVRLSVAMVSLDFIMNITLIWPLGETGLSWSSSLSALVQASALLIMLRAKAGVGPVFDAGVRHSALQTLLSTLVMAAATCGVILALPLSSPAWISACAEVTGAPDSWTYQLVKLLLIVATGAASFTAAAALLRQPELGWVLGRKPA